MLTRYTLGSLAFLLTAPLLAQCPYERAETVLEQIQIVGSVQCFRAEQSPDDSFRWQRAACPIMVRIPLHHTSAASTAPTQVLQVGSAPVFLIDSECRPARLLSLRFGAVCRPRSPQLIGTVPLLQTAPCLE